VSHSPLTAELLDAPVEGLNLVAGTLRDQITADRPTLLVFLRHLGCVFCREMVRDVRSAVEQTPDYPPVLFFFQGTPDDGRAFFAAHFPGARAVADLPRRFYDAMGLRQGSVAQMFSPRVWLCGLRAVSKGNLQTIRKPIGDPWLMPGCFLIERERVLWRHKFLHAGDHPDFARIPQILAGSASDASVVSGRARAGECALPHSQAPAR
jgi:hypothetical protein